PLHSFPTRRSSDLALRRDEPGTGLYGGRPVPAHGRRFEPERRAAAGTVSGSTGVQAGPERPERARPVPAHDRPTPGLVPGPNIPEQDRSMPARRADRPEAGPAPNAPSGPDPYRLMTGRLRALCVARTSRSKTDRCRHGERLDRSPGRPRTPRARPTDAGSPLDPECRRTSERPALNRRQLVVSRQTRGVPPAAGGAGLRRRCPPGTSAACPPAAAAPARRAATTAASPGSTPRAASPWPQAGAPTSAPPADGQSRTAT